MDDFARAIAWAIRLYVWAMLFAFAFGAFRGLLWLLLGEPRP